MPSLVCPRVKFTQPLPVHLSHVTSSTVSLGGHGHGGHGRGVGVVCLFQKNVKLTHNSTPSGKERSVI